MKSSSSTKVGLDNMFNNGTGFSDTTLDGTGKKVGNKTFASSVASSTVKPMFDDMITDFTSNVIPNWSTTAANGTAGKMTDSKRTVYINAKGHELTQLFTKGLIGGMCLDQIVNNYLQPCQLDSGTRRDDNTNGTLASGKNYTDMEHKWDEAFGYLYGQEADYSRADLGSAPTGNGTTLNKYFKKINDSNMPGISQTVYDAFKLGRAAIVAGNYEVRDAQANIIKINLSKVIGYKSVDYLNGYMSKMAACLLYTSPSPRDRG